MAITLARRLELTKRAPADRVGPPASARSAGPRNKRSQLGIVQRGCARARRSFTACQVKGVPLPSSRRPRGRPRCRLAAASRGHRRQTRSGIVLRHTTHDRAHQRPELPPSGCSSPTKLPQQLNVLRAQLRSQPAPCPNARSRSRSRPIVGSGGGAVSCVRTMSSSGMRSGSSRKRSERLGFSGPDGHVAVTMIFTSPTGYSDRRRG